MACDALQEMTPSRANRRYLEILHLAAAEGEARVDDALRGLLEAGEIAEGELTADSIRAVLATQTMEPPTSILVADVALSSFDELLNAADNPVFRSIDPLVADHVPFRVFVHDLEPHSTSNLRLIWQ